MLILGLSGLFASARDRFMTRIPRGYAHDSAAALVSSDKIIMAVEEERLSRVKHSNSFPALASEACLEAAGVGPADIDRVAYFFEESYTDRELTKELILRRGTDMVSSRRLIIRRLTEHLGPGISAEQVEFHEHHRTHAATAFLQSGFERAAVCIIDGHGEDDAVSLFAADADGLQLIRKYPVQDSLGMFYSTVTRLLRFSEFDEYKVMGLAPLGTANRYREVLAGLYRLGSEGSYTLDVASVADTLLRAGFAPRDASVDFRLEDADLAAAAQEVLESIVLHILRHLRSSTGLTSLCLGGGVAHNSTMNGRVLAAGMFDRVFVHAASHDGGSALGAALASHWHDAPIPPTRFQLGDVYLGPHAGDSAVIENQLKRWSALVDWTPAEDVSSEAAGLLADGAVIGWVQGRSEYGPRALGNRSILADARPAENKTRVNAVIKKREGYRPFAPAVLDSAAEEYFELGTTEARHDFMGYTSPVRPDRRQELGAVTHVDGSARVQVVTRQGNARFHRLIEEFGRLTGTPVLLNTSFNNAAEPIVQSAEDAIVSFLTTGLDALVVGDCIVRRRQVDWQVYLDFRPRLAAFVALSESRECFEGRVIAAREAVPERGEGKPTSVSRETYDLLARADGRQPLSALLHGDAAAEPLVAELLELWDKRLITLNP